MYTKVLADLASDLRVVLQHLLKLQFQPGDNELTRRTRGWKLSTIEHRARTEIILDGAPSLRKKISEFVDKAYKGARKPAALHMSLEEGALPAKCPWSPEQILDLDFFPQRAPASNGNRNR